MSGLMVWSASRIGSDSLILFYIFVLVSQVIPDILLIYPRINVILYKGVSLIAFLFCMNNHVLLMKCVARINLDVKPRQ